MSNNSATLKIRADKELHERLVEKMKARLKDLPDGSLCLKTINGKEYPYHYTYSTSKQSKGKKVEMQKYLPKEQSALKEALQEKAYLEKAVAHLADTLDVENEFLSKYQPFDPLKIIAGLPKSCGDFNLVANINCFDMRDSDAEEWPPTGKSEKPFYTDGLAHVTSTGIKVRSKSESIIATLLDMNEIPYRYEVPITLGNHTYYPDFTIMRPTDRKLFYWEHFGMMSDSRYYEKAIKKLETYIKYGLMPWDQLITTFESNEENFDAQHIDKIIKLLLAL